MARVLSEKWKDKLHGGKADKEKPSDFDPRELEKGAEDEREHSDDPTVPYEIAMDHLVSNPHYYDDLEKAGISDSVWYEARSRLVEDSGQTVNVQTKSGMKLKLSFEEDEFSLHTTIWKNGVNIGGVDVDVWPQRKVAYVELAFLLKRYVGQGIGQAVYPVISKKCQELFGCKLSSDEDGNRSEHAEHLWKKLVSLGKAKRAKDRYTMTEVWKRLESILREQGDEEDDDLMSRISGVRAPAPYGSEEKPDKKPDRMDMLKQRSQVTKGGTVKLKRPEISVNDVTAKVRDFLKTGPKTLFQVMKMLTNHYNPDSKSLTGKWLQGAIHGMGATLTGKGVNINSLLRLMADGPDPQDNTWKLKGG